MIPLTFAACAVLALLAGHVDALEIGEACVTPNGSRETCLKIRDCNPLLDLLKEKPLSQANVEFLRKSQCGHHDRQPLVCCPRPNLATEPPNVEVVEDVNMHRNLPLLRNDLCGPVFDNRLIGGNRTKLSELPWMALIAYSGSEENESTFGCSGTIINDLYILTAAHCVKNLKPGIRPIFVRLGEHNLDSSIDCEEEEIYDTYDMNSCAPEPQDIPIAQTIAHPEYTGKSDRHNDIALIRLTKQINFSADSVRPVCLPIGLSVEEQNLVGKRMEVAGWGITENEISSRIPLKFSVQVKTNAECAQVYKNQAQISKTSQLCAGGARGGDQSCPWDSGGPLNYYGHVEGYIRVIQHGIMSFGPKTCGITCLPAVYTRVGFYRKWILDNISPCCEAT